MIWAGVSEVCIFATESEPWQQAFIRPVYFECRTYEGAVGHESSFLARHHVQHGYSSTIRGWKSQFWTSNPSTIEWSWSEPGVNNVTKSDTIALDPLSKIVLTLQVYGESDEADDSSNDKECNANTLPILLARTRRNQLLKHYSYVNVGVKMTYKRSNKHYFMERKYCLVRAEKARSAHLSAQ